MTTTPHRIVLIGDPRTEEAIAAGTITPGMLIMLQSTGKVVAHNDLGGIAERAFATEDALQGRTIDDDYAATERVNFALCKPGDVVYAWLAGGYISAIGDHLVSNGDGTLSPAGSGGYAQIVAVALEVVDGTDSESVKSRMKVRIL